MVMSIWLLGLFQFSTLILKQQFSRSPYSICQVIHVWLIIPMLKHSEYLKFYRTGSGYN